MLQACVHLGSATITIYNTRTRTLEKTYFTFTWFSWFKTRSAPMQKRMLGIYVP